MIAILAALTGCNGEPEDSAVPCGVEISDKDIWPAAGSTDFYYRGAIEVHLSDADDTAEISMDADGVSGTSWRSDDDKTVFFQPDAPLAPSTPYSYTVSYCTADVVIDFTTSGLGEDIADVDGLVGQVYELDLASGRIVVPEGVGSVLESYLTVQVLLEVLSSGDEIEFLGAIADEDNPGTQDFCIQTLEFPEAADFSDAPYFVIGPATTTISVADYEVTIEDLEISGTFSADGTWFGGAVFAGSIDTRPLAELVGDDEEEDAVCNLVAGFGVSCIECPDSTPYCLKIRAVDLSAIAVDTDVEEVAVEDCHESCADSCDNAECDTTDWAICEEVPE